MAWERDWKGGLRKKRKRKETEGRIKKRKEKRSNYRMENKRRKEEKEELRIEEKKGRIKEWKKKEGFLK